jgi:ABC-2 type transport system permease protein
MSCLFGASMTGSNLLMEMQTGSHERTLVTPLSARRCCSGGR